MFWENEAKNYVFLWGKRILVRKEKRGKLLFTRNCKPVKKNLRESSFLLDYDGSIWFMMKFLRWTYFKIVRSLYMLAIRRIFTNFNPFKRESQVHFYGMHIYIWIFDYCSQKIQDKLIITNSLLKISKYCIYYWQRNNGITSQNNTILKHHSNCKWETRKPYHVKQHIIEFPRGGCLPFPQVFI